MLVDPYSWKIFSSDWTLSPIVWLNKSKKYWNQQLRWCLSLCRSRIPLCTQGFLRYRLTNQPPVTRQPAPTTRKLTSTTVASFFRQQQKYRGHSRTPSQTIHYWGDIPQNYQKHYLMPKNGATKTTEPWKTEKKTRLASFLSRICKNCVLPPNSQPPEPLARTRHAMAAMALQPGAV